MFKLPTGGIVEGGVRITVISYNLLAGLFATSAAGVLFGPRGEGMPYVYEEVGSGGCGSEGE